MIVERSMDEQFLSNAYLVADEEGGAGVVIDAGAPAEPLLAAVERLGVTVEHVLLTHHHWDHVYSVEELTTKLGARSYAHPVEAELVPQMGLPEVGERIEPGETIRAGGLEIEAVHTPGHTAGMLSLVVNGAEVFTGDTLFKGSVGGVRAPGSTGFDDIRRSVFEVLMGMPHERVVRPGHTEPTTIGDEWESNAFVRVWRGLDPEGSEPCLVGGADEEGEEATLVLLAPDYDGGHKAWVRWPDGKDDIVPGSRIKDA